MNKDEESRKQAQIETTLHAQDVSNLPERLKSMVEKLEEDLEVKVYHTNKVRNL